MRYDPGTDAAERMPDWVIRHRTGLRVPEVMCPIRKVILIERGHTAAERRCSLAHAIAHVDLGHTTTSVQLTPRQEQTADRLAARRLIEIHALADALVWAESFEELAHELDVDPTMLTVRARSLHPAERGYLLRVIEAKIVAA